MMQAERMVYKLFSAITQFNRTLPKGGIIAVAGAAMFKQKCR
jgi:hypothetical protein